MFQDIFLVPSKMKLLNSNMIIYFGNERRKVPLSFSVLSFESLPQTDSPNLLILFLVKDTQTRIQENFYIIFFIYFSSNNVCIAM